MKLLILIFICYISSYGADIPLWQSDKYSGVWCVTGVLNGVEATYELRIEFPDTTTSIKITEPDSSGCGEYYNPFADSVRFYTYISGELNILPNKMLWSGKCYIVLYFSNENNFTSEDELMKSGYKIK